MTNWPGRITIDEKVPGGKPVIEGTRLAVEHVIELLAQGWSEAQIVENYPGIGPGDVQACLRYAAEVLKSEKVFPLAV